MKNFYCKDHSNPQMFDSERPDNTPICRGGLYLKITIHVNPAYAWQAPKSERYVSKWRMAEEQERHKEYSRNRTNNKMGKGKQKNEKGGRTDRKQYMSEKDQLITRRRGGKREGSHTGRIYLDEELQAKSIMMKLVFAPGGLHFFKVYGLWWLSS